MAKILIIDNYDSFTYNLLHLVEQFAEEVVVVRNDAIILSEVAVFDGIILSPGPGLPKNTGEMNRVIHQYHKDKKILGICLGHQAIAEYFGATLYNLAEVAHGMSAKIEIQNTNNPIFKGIPNAFMVGRYHSWAVSENALPENLIIDAKTTDEIIMALHHKHFPMYGLQFHPESILSEFGAEMIKNWILIEKNM